VPTRLDWRRRADCHPVGLGERPSRAVVVGVVAAVIAALGLGVAVWLVVQRGSDEAGTGSSTAYSMSGTGMEPTLSHGDPTAPWRPLQLRRTQLGT
jgi:hypothetical protein